MEPEIGTEGSMLFLRRAAVRGSSQVVVNLHGQKEAYQGNFA